MLKNNGPADFCPRDIEKMFIFLDQLRRSGVTNMFGAAPHLVSYCPDLTIEQAREVLSYWMASDLELTPAARVAALEIQP